MSRVRIGDFSVNLTERRVFKSGIELAAEPKVLDVLCYLIANRDRFVSLKELHDNVWAGRVVTDTAVRRTISKLRVLLDDTDANNPKYIKSQMKRGYQLICDVTAIDPAAEAQMIEQPVIINGNTGKQFLFRKSLLIGLVITVVMLVAIYYWYAQSRPQPVNQLVEVETLLSIPGRKTSLSVSKDGRLHAFVGRLDGDSNWELFLYDSAAGQLKKIDTPTEHCRFVTFIDNDTRLAYVGYDGSQASFFTQSVLNLNELPVFHPTAPFQLLGNSVELAPNKVLIAASNSLLDNLHYYKYDLTANTFEQFTYSSGDGVQDAFASISADKQLVALGRASLNERNVMLQIYRIADKELIAEYKLQDSMLDFRISWIDNNTLLTRTGYRHSLINIDNGDRTVVEAEPHPLHEFSFTATGELYGLSYQVSAADIYQAQWPFTGHFTTNYRLGSKALQLSFSHDSDTHWLVEKEPDSDRLYRYAESQNQRQLVMQTAEPFYLQDQTTDGSLLLLKKNNRLEVFNIVTAEFVSVSVSTQDVRSGNFSLNGKYVYFSERVKEQWQVKRYSLIDKTQSVLLADHIFIRDIADGYIAADSMGNVWRLDNDYNKIHLLYQGVIFDLEYQFVLHDSQLIIAFRTIMGDWILADINLISQKVWQRSLPFNDFSLPFSIDYSGRNFIFKTRLKEEYQLVKYGYNFGYNFGAK
ncbi:winged helix-turn-helix domain-containing protein [Arsukibacterium ikkense]|uniref:winged helix-turn-helix domain-containing protein n=1 Tax=Arsukibacterium ikkense TaxID=336831 RepID=UPI00069CABCE|nr:winged helix-turn-helix domain-containing protein [Arsukibacterium ikkense]